MKLWYDRPAKNWNQALPIGNGRLGGMIFAGIEEEFLQLNEDSVWYGGPRDRNNPDTRKYLGQIRQFLMEGKIKKAEELIVPAMSGLPENQRHYQPFIDLEIKTGHDKEKVKDYRRELNIEQAVARTAYTLGEVNYQREFFSSAPDQVIVVRFTADKKGQIDLKCRLRRLGTTGDRREGYTHFIDSISTYDNNEVMLRGNTGGSGDSIEFFGGLKVRATGGNCSLIGETFIIEAADEVTLFVGGTTNFYHDVPDSVLRHQLGKAYSQNYSQLKRNHVQDYQRYYQRVDFKLSGPDLSDMPVDKRLKRLEKGKKDSGLVVLYFNYGRYLLISASRPGTQAANLQGIWNNQWLPPWDSKYTININLEMNYWPAELCNLSELQQPLFDLIERMRENGRITAQTLYDADGFCAHHNTDIWGDTAPQGTYIPASYWAMGGAWLCTHLWEHYLFTKDPQFLEKVYPVLKDAGKFIIDYLIEDEKGRLVTCPSVSPENKYILPDGEKGSLCAGPAMDSQIIRFLFNSILDSAAILNVEEKEHEFLEKIATVKDAVPEISIGKYGQIMEWREDYEEVDPGHRHISHLWALHPGNEISPINTPELAEAARVTLERRLEHGGGHTGWSRAWIINFWARLFDSEKAYQNLRQLLVKSTMDNLFDNHPPFQIDGNFGGTAGIVEMLLQSSNGEIHLLPALPEAWPTGKIEGVCARGGFEVNIYWEKGVLVKAKIRSKTATDSKVRYQQKTVKLNFEAGEEITLHSSDF